MKHNARHECTDGRRPPDRRTATTEFRNPMKGCLTPEMIPSGGRQPFMGLPGSARRRALAEDGSMIGNPRRAEPALRQFKQSVMAG